jgi:hypothetical protein
VTVRARSTHSDVIPTTKRTKSPPTPQQDAGTPALKLMQQQVKISSAFDSGNIKVAEPPSVKDSYVDIGLEIVPDPFCEIDNQAHFQVPIHLTTFSEILIVLDCRLRNSTCNNNLRTISAL